MWFATWLPLIYFPWFGEQRPGAKVGHPDHPQPSVVTGSDGAKRNLPPRSHQSHSQAGECKADEHKLQRWWLWWCLAAAPHSPRTGEGQDCPGRNPAEWHYATQPIFPLASGNKVKKTFLGELRVPITPIWLGNQGED